MKKREILISFFLVCAIICFAVLNFGKSYSLSMNVTITGNKGSRVLKYYDENNREISIDAAIKYYGATRYQEMPSEDGSIYFYNGKEISASTYKKGYASEQADIRAAKYGDAGIRVSTTENFKKAWDNIFLNFLSGKFSFNWSPYDNINFEEVERYVMSKYGVLDPRQNYYTYSVKGPQEPIRFSLNLANYKNQGEFVYENYFTRHTGAEKKKVDNFLDNLFRTEMPSANASDYEKILASFVYITSHSRYYVDDGFINDYLSGFTSMYDNLLGEHPNNKNYGATNCIGYAVTFSYFMERYGIESYIVDGATTLDVANKKYTSDHTYNLVKLDGKFYRIDLTFGNSYFLIPMTSGILYDTKLNLATKKYTNETPTYKFNEDNISKYKAQARNLKVSTTTKRALTTGKTQTMSVNKTTAKHTNPKTTDITTTTPAYKPPVTESSTSNNSTLPITTNSSSTTISTSQNSVIQSTTKNESTDEKDRDDKFIFNTIMIGLLLLTIIGYIIYKIVSSKNKKSSLSMEAQAILNRDIIRTEEDDESNQNNINTISNQSISSTLQDTNGVNPNTENNINMINNNTSINNANNMTTNEEITNNLNSAPQPQNTYNGNNSNNITNNNEGNNIN